MAVARNDATYLKGEKKDIQGRQMRLRSFGERSTITAQGQRCVAGNKSVVFLYPGVR